MPMPQDDPVKKALDSAKKVLAGANDFEKSAGGPMKKDAPKVTAKPATDSKPAPKPKSEGLLGDMDSAAKGVSYKKQNVEEYNKVNPNQPLKPYKDGGKVEKTGPAKLDAGETVLPTDKKKAAKLAIEHLDKKAGAMAAAVKDEESDKPAAKKDGEKHKPDESKPEAKKHKVKGVHFRHGHSGGYIAKHDSMEGEDGKMGEMQEHVLPNMAAMMAHLKDHFSDGQDVPDVPQSEPQQ